MTDSVVKLPAEYFDLERMKVSEVHTVSEVSSFIDLVAVLGSKQERLLGPFHGSLDIGSFPFSIAFAISFGFCH